VIRSLHRNEGDNDGGNHTVWSIGERAAGVAAHTQDRKAARRMLAIALVLEGWSREAAAEACAIDHQNLSEGNIAVGTD
jgi:hypothetical protein